MICMVCGKQPSCITVYRRWLRELVRSDECIDCHGYMNAKFGVVYVPSREAVPGNAQDVLAQTASYRCEVIDILTRRKVAS